MNSADPKQTVSIHSFCDLSKPEFRKMAM